MITINTTNLPGIILPGNTSNMKAFCQQFYNKDYTERQANGLIIEHFLIYARIINAITNSNYYTTDSQEYNTPGIDCYTNNGNIPIPVQIKAKKTGRGILNGLHDNDINTIKPTQIELGSGNNEHLYKDTDFIIDIVSYNSHNMTVNRVVYYIDHDKWNNAINPRNDEILSIDHVFDGISKDKSDDAKWRKRRTEITNEYYDAMPDCKFKPRFKRDHKGQHRIQMAISDWDLVELSSAVYKDDNFKYKIK